MRVEQQEETSQEEVDKTDTDSQIIAMNLEFDPGANTAEQNFDNCKANMKKFQHREIANHQAIGNQQEERSQEEVDKTDCLFGL